MNIQVNLKSIASTMLLAFVLLLAGCGSGSDGAAGATGATGPAGPAGPEGPPALEVSQVQTELVVTIDSATFEGKPVVNFTVLDQDGLPYVDLPSIRFTLSKLISGENGDSSTWQSYINVVETADGNGPGTVDTIQATADSNGTLENHQNGTYTYTFANDISNITTPLAVTFEPTLTHRLGMQLSGNGQPVANAVLDIRPSDGATTGLFTREIVKIDSCNECHGKLALHGGGRIATKLCVTCHNPGSTDANSGNTIDFKVMIHKIHRGENLHAVRDGGEYAIWGFRDTKHDYSDVLYPQDLRHCTKCHDQADTDTPDAANWETKPTMETCGSCHDDVDFSQGVAGNHPGGVMTDNADCTVCHKEGGFAGSVASSHEIPDEITSAKYAYNILAVTNTGPGELPTVKFSVTDPTNGNATYDIKTDPAFTAGGGASGLVIDIAWNTNEYTNNGSGNGTARAAVINALSDSVANGDGTFSATSTVAIPLTETGSGTVGIEGHPAGDFDHDGVYTDRLRSVNSVVSTFAITDSSPKPRREVVDNAKCNNCHNQLSLHHGNRVGEVRLCVMCHNPRNTDRKDRLVPASANADGLQEQSVDFKRMIHGIHGSEHRVKDYYVGTENFGVVGFPGILNNCKTCHKDGTYELPLGDNVLGSTMNTGPSSDPLDWAVQENHKVATPIAAVCSSCHDEPLAIAHMKQNGGASFDTTQTDINNWLVVETCQFCHGPGGIKDVNEVHGIE